MRAVLSRGKYATSQKPPRKMSGTRKYGPLVQKEAAKRQKTKLPEERIEHTLLEDIAQARASTLQELIADLVTMISFERYTDPSADNIQIHQKEPGWFQLGDIVEMGFALVAFRQASRNEDDKQICKLLLRTLMLLEMICSQSNDKDYPEKRHRMAAMRMGNSRTDMETSGTRSLSARTESELAVRTLTKRRRDLYEPTQHQDKTQWWNESKEDCLRVSIKNIFGDTEFSRLFGVEESRHVGKQPAYNNLIEHPGPNNSTMYDDVIKHPWPNRVPDSGVTTSMTESPGVECLYSNERAVNGKRENTGPVRYRLHLPIIRAPSRELPDTRTGSNSRAASLGTLGGDRQSTPNKCLFVLCLFCVGPAYSLL
ncbi:hypothetical protein B0H17DRAFT_1147251 [Mycena rosella]|uniref:Uncharacterized protein n=1 Tax=Mycena rosella TaxID=1033263 RepID=A0AAD7CMA1_MYCRO|nr:hypothetical protein B0H17DRAFT_1147251 [Mycena rosella]